MNTTEQLIKLLQQGRFDEKLAGLYGKAKLAEQRARYIAVLEQYGKTYGWKREVRVFSVPGRTEIGGNHTDHENGAVLAAAIDLDMVAVVALNGTNIVRLQSRGFFGEDDIDIYQRGPYAEEKGTTASIIRGMAMAFRYHKYEVYGFDAYLDSEIMPGAGLSSSAVLENMLGTILNCCYNDGNVPFMEIAKMGQWVENNYFGKPSGLMDQIASIHGGAVAINFQNAEQPEVRPVELDLSAYDMVMCITDTGESHADLSADYAAVRNEMEEVAVQFGETVLGNVQEELFYEKLPALHGILPDRALLRAMHFFSENNRAKAMAQAVQNHEIDTFLRLVSESGHSSCEYNQNAVQPGSVEKQSIPLALAMSEKILGGSSVWRIHGGGFGGSIQAFLPKRMLPAYKAAMDKLFGNGCCREMQIRPQGAVELTESAKAAPYETAVEVQENE